MNEETLIQFAGKPLESMPVEIQEQLASDPQLKQALEEQRFVSQLMSLKQYETPDARMSERVRRNVRISISKNMPLAQRMSLKNAHLLPAWARMAAVVVIMLGLSVLTHREMLRYESAESVDLALEAQQQAVDLAATSLRADVVHTSELVHRDAFTTHLPERFLFPLPDFDPAFAQNPAYEMQPLPEPTVAPFLHNPVTLPVLNPVRP